MNRANARELRRILASKDLRASLQSFLRKASPKKMMKPAKKERLNKEKVKRETRNEETARIRGACLARSGGVCECGCAEPFSALPISIFVAEMDEWLNGNGRRRQRRAIATCWMLTRGCHRLRQQYLPSVAFWNEKRRAHDEKHGYKHFPHIEHAAIQRRKVLSASPEARGYPLPEPKATQGDFLPEDPEC